MRKKGNWLVYCGLGEMSATAEAGSKKSPLKATPVIIEHGRTARREATSSRRAAIRLKQNSLLYSKASCSVCFQIAEADPTSMG
jgi:hypothetical protein